MIVDKLRKRQRKAGRRRESPRAIEKEKIFRRFLQGEERSINPSCGVTDSPPSKKSVRGSRGEKSSELGEIGMSSGRRARIDSMLMQYTHPAGQLFEGAEREKKGDVEHSGF